MAVWDDPGVPWGDFDLVWCAARGTTRHGTGLPRVGGLGPAPREPLRVLAWNTDKHYLRPRASGCAGHRDPLARAGGPATFFDRPFVVKPAVGAGSRDAQRYEPGETGAAAEHVARCMPRARPPWSSPT